MSWDGSSFPEFNADCTSLLARYLSRQMYDRLKDKTTKNGYKFLQAINSGVINQDSQIGVYAGDAESYDLFSPLLDLVIEDYHGFSKDDRHRSDFDLSRLSISNPDPDGEFIVSTRIRVGRNVADIPLGAAMNSSQRCSVETLVANSVRDLKGELAGTYYPLKGMDDGVQRQLIKDHFLFKDGDRFLAAAGLNRHWPEGRGIFHNQEKTFLVWVNEEDQLRIISMQQGGDIQAVFERLLTGVHAIAETVPYLYDRRLGYLTSCPSNLGTAMRASVHIRLPKLALDLPAFNLVAEEHHLQIRGVHGEHSSSEDGVFDISNTRRLGITEIDCVQELYQGVVALINKEKQISTGPVDKTPGPV
ncbi:creatine kinase [Desulfuromusa kysingii]|uniref:Creatine kinase n=1 Tax=Desulfuromusa kysingii TaxID=37625 RepID=A0A1H4DNB8_9BACT|nr:arginine kinase [Desulfuromusa kysingii]SEA74273.1 creatine kinase [Desulfuromusa kysingii]